MHPVPGRLTACAAVVVRIERQRQQDVQGPLIARPQLMGGLCTFAIWCSLRSASRDCADVENNLRGVSMAEGSGPGVDKHARHSRAPCWVCQHMT